MSGPGWCTTVVLALFLQDGLGFTALQAGLTAASYAVGVALAARVSGKPVVVYPNAGERWDAGARRWTGDRTAVAGLVDTWLDAGARLVGGCCRVGPDEIASVAGAVARRTAPTAV